MVRDLSGAVIAVVGAGGGLGGPIVSSLSRHGAQLVLAGRNTDRLRALGIPGAEVVQVDLRDSMSGQRIAVAAKSRHDRLDGLVNAAGVVAFGPLEDLDDELIEELFLTNVLGPLWLIRRVLPMLRESCGFVANISAVVAEQPLPNLAVYSATKAALTAADKSLARELRRVGVHVCDARPPHTETGLATRPIAGEAPRLPVGLDPQVVAERIVQGIENGESEIPASAFAAVVEPG